MNRPGAHSSTSPLTRLLVYAFTCLLSMSVLRYNARRTKQWTNQTEFLPSWSLLFFQGRWVLNKYYKTNFSNKYIINVPEAYERERNRYTCRDYVKFERWRKASLKKFGLICEEWRKCNEKKSNKEFPITGAWGIMASVPCNPYTLK